LELRYCNNGTHAKQSTLVEINLHKDNFYSSEGIHKGIVLQRYVEIIKTFLDSSTPESKANLVTSLDYFVNEAQHFGTDLDENLAILQKFTSKNAPTANNAGCIVM